MYLEKAISSELEQTASIIKRTGFFDKVDNLLHNLTMINIDEVKDEVISNLKVTVNNYLLSNELNDEYKNKMCFLIKKYCISKLEIIQILFNSFDY